ncbi:MAG: MBL fold metallo-hydrolase [Candidatus Cloacimonetes bacterium]|nr:MBL fold metallo-hydrolase [Candidatus Cloacimonadota bacterium]MCF7813890.1 MBL fold metallo-hydrolase [Candidatus Cloacimonadota bacterium]MCF7868899.1 MBL fold metallo-hydrolase [Candidatus Cloacimonadota bacterium]MCF7884002.1 MBL fold metallo-hydrolase [Candidatus Cloacimonadota bacterium]
MKITIVYDNTTEIPGLLADWGWSCLVEKQDRKILFDTGGNGKILLENMLALNIDPTSIDDVVISHSDFDHIGGLSTFLNANPTAVVHIPISFRGIHYPNQVKYYNSPTEIYSGFFLSGELDKREQSLAVKTEKGLVLVVGCGHPGVGKIMESFSQFGDICSIVGGLHGFKEFELLTNIEKICPSHCTVHKARIKQLHPEKYLEGGVGEVFLL